MRKQERDNVVSLLIQNNDLSDAMRNITSLRLHSRRRRRFCYQLSLSLSLSKKKSVGYGDMWGVQLQLQ